jgi:hypothetical protein
MIDPRWVTVVRILFISGRNLYERNTLGREEYHRRQEQRDIEGCVGCFVLFVIAILMIVFLMRSGAA